MALQQSGPTFIPNGDRELWVASFASDESGAQVKCSVPVYCDPKVIQGEPERGRYYFVYPAIQIRTFQFEKLLSWLSAFRVNREKDVSIIHERDLPRVATKAPGITPERYFSWGGQPDNETGVEAPTGITIADMEEAHYAFDRDTEHFLRYFSARSSATTPAMLRIFWRELGRIAIEYLTRERRPINFGAFTVQPLPYRGNWKEILYAKLARIARLLSDVRVGIDNHPMNVEAKRWGVFEQLYCHDNIGWLQGYDSFQWSFELRPSKTLDKESADAERIDRKSMSSAEYVKHWTHYVRAYEKSIMDHLVRYFQKMETPAADLSRHRDQNNKRFVPHIPDGRVRAQIRIRYDQLVATPAKPRNNPFLIPQTTPNGETTLLPASQLLSEVSLVLPQTSHMRDGGRDDAQPVRPENNDTWLLVQHDAGSLGTGESVLAQSAEPEPPIRLAGGVVRPPEEAKPDQ